MLSNMNRNNKNNISSRNVRNQMSRVSNGMRDSSAYPIAIQPSSSPPGMGFNLTRDISRSEMSNLDNISEQRPSQQ